MLYQSIHHTYYNFYVMMKNLKLMKKRAFQRLFASSNLLVSPFLVWSIVLLPFLLFMPRAILLVTAAFVSMTFFFSFLGIVLCRWSFVHFRQFKVKFFLYFNRFCWRSFLSRSCSGRYRFFSWHRFDFFHFLSNQEFMPMKSY